MKNDKFCVKDIRTGKIHEVPRGLDTVYITTTDGDRVRVHPVFISLTVPKGHLFSGHTLKGTRELRRVT